MHTEFKGINSGLLDSTIDIGNDGLVTTPVNPFAKDAYGFTLGYFHNDFTPIGGTPFEIDYYMTGSGSAFGDESYPSGEVHIA